MDETHIFRAYVDGRGYTLFLGKRRKGFLTHPLDILTDALPRNYEASRTAIDEKIGPDVPWAICVYHGCNEIAPMLAYGCRWNTGEAKLGTLRFPRYQLEEIGNTVSSLRNILMLLRFYGRPGSPKCSLC